MNFDPQLSQEDLARFADENDLKFEVKRSHWPKWQGLILSAYRHLEEGYKIRLAPGALTEFGLKSGMQPHNPDGLTADVITEGGKYRAVTIEEIHIANSGQTHSRFDYYEQGSWIERHGFYWTEDRTYRVPVNTPFPKPVPATEESSSAQSDTPNLKYKIVGVLESYTREIGNSHFHGSNPGVPKEDFEEVAEQILSLIKP